MGVEVADDDEEEEDEEKGTWVQSETLGRV